MDVSGSLESLLDERSVGHPALGTERGIHDHGIHLLFPMANLDPGKGTDIDHLGVGSGPSGLFQCPVVHIHALNTPGSQQGGPHQQPAGTATQIGNPAILDMTPPMGLE